MKRARAAFADRLAGGDRRSTGAADAVAASVRAEPGRFAELWACLQAADPLVRFRAADAAEKLSRVDPALLAPYRQALLSGALDDGTPELRWHLAAMVARLALSPAEAERAFARLAEACRSDPSRLARVAALQGAWEIAAAHPGLAAAAEALRAEAEQGPYPSLRARARRLAAQSCPSPRA